ncbi:hypothetical protein C8F04DRAFT_1391151 [Mycena alexandri]|uniref:Protein kinase domain-containing protein n=1 Tax=Mycena alexandri TaxID=1745969 RepID=A0AAD6T871_9AGAR|nr:hypothetical protein C8F04DRAFT_1391151 [Mycena alexandri]
MDSTESWWANWLKEYEEGRRAEEASKPPAYAIMHYPAWLWGLSRDVPLDLMTREDLVTRHTSSSPPPAPSSLSSSSPHILTINPETTGVGNKASFYEATFVLAGGPPLNVFMKTYPVEDFDLLCHEFDVYTTVGHLDVVPKLYAVVKGRSTDWGGLIMEHAGTSLSIYNLPWEKLLLSRQDKLNLYDAFRQLHAAGVVHGDVAARNILRRPSGAFCLVDFDRSTIGHLCPGSSCEELAQLQRDLGLEVIGVCI